MSISILLADDHKIIRDGLRALLEKERDMKVVGEAENGRTTVQFARTLLPDVVIMDIGMPDLNGIEATRQIATISRLVKVIALSMHSDKRFVKGMLQAGASGYLLKECAFEELAQAIRAVYKNRTYLSPEIASLVVEEYVSPPVTPDTSAASILTPRQREVLQLFAEGKTTKEIAFHLGVSVKTIETHRQKIMDKLGTHSIAELTKYALREGLTMLDN